MAVDQTLTLAHLAIPILGLLIPIIAIVAHYGSRVLADRQRHETIRAFARAGQPVPPELLAESSEPARQRRPASPTSDGGACRVLLPAVVNIGLGAGIAGLFAVMSPGSWLWAIGLVPLALGLSLLLMWWAVRKPSNSPSHTP